MKFFSKHVLWIGSITAFVVISLSLGLGLGLGLQNNGKSTNKENDKKNVEQKYKVYGKSYSKKELLKGISINGKTYKANEQNGKLYYTIPKNTKLIASPLRVIENNFHRGQDTKIEGNVGYYNIEYANIGIVKMGYDGKILGGYYKDQSNNITLRNGLNSPISFGRITQNGLGLINLAIVHELQKHIKNNVVEQGYIPDKETTDSWSWKIFAFEDSEKNLNIVARVGTNSFPKSVLDIAGNPNISGKEYIHDGHWPGQNTPRPPKYGSGDQSWWGDDGTKPLAWKANREKKDFKFKTRELVDKDGNEIQAIDELTLLKTEDANVVKHVPIKGFYFKLGVTSGSVDIPMYKKSIPINLNGVINVFKQHWEINKATNTYTFTNDFEFEIKPI